MGRADPGRDVGVPSVSLASRNDGDTGVDGDDDGRYAGGSCNDSRAEYGRSLEEGGVLVG